jgi:hypothetical protein
MSNGELEKDKQAEELAKRHYTVEEGVTEIIRFKASFEVEVQRGEPIKLLEVNANTVPSGIMPIQFGPSPEFGVTYPTTVIEVTPDEYERIRRHELKLPQGWQIPEPIQKPTT